MKTRTSVKAGAGIMTTNHNQELKPGDGLYAFFLNAQGRILADAHILCYEDSLLLDTEPETRALVYEHLDRYIIADDVTLEDETDATFCLGLEGAQALAVAEAAGINVAGQSTVCGGVLRFVG